MLAICVRPQTISSPRQSSLFHSSLYLSIHPHHAVPQVLVEDDEVPFYTLPCEWVSVPHLGLGTCNHSKNSWQTSGMCLRVCWRRIHHFPAGWTDETRCRSPSWDLKPHTVDGFDRHLNKQQAERCAYTQPWGHPGATEIRMCVEGGVKAERAACLAPSCLLLRLSSPSGVSLFPAWRAHDVCGRWPQLIVQLMSWKEKNPVGKTFLLKNVWGDSWPQGRCVNTCRVDLALL